MFTKTTKKYVVCAVSAAFWYAAITFAQTNQSTNLPPRAAPRGTARLQELEEKAAERDRMAEHALQLEEELISLQQQLGIGDSKRPRSGRGRLDSLERKAAQFEQVVLINEAKTEQIRLLTEENDELRLAMTETEEEFVSLRNNFTEITHSNDVLHGIIQSLQQTIDQLLLGNFEYYEVREENETLASIAGLPMVYGDTNKASLLIAPNKKRVSNLKELQIGDVLVIPRFPASGKYLW